MCVLSALGGIVVSASEIKEPLGEMNRDTSAPLEMANFFLSRALLSLSWPLIAGIRSASGWK